MARTLHLMEVVGIRVELPTNSTLVLLREADGARYVPIWIGAAEASAIAFAEQRVAPQRPMSHDLFAGVLRLLGHTFTRAVIDRFEDGIFYARLRFDGDYEIGGRPSDAIALALRTGTPVYMVEDVLEETGMLLPDEDDAAVDRFREFLDTISPDDFLDRGEGRSQ